MYRKTKANKFVRQVGPGRQRRPAQQRQRVARGTQQPLRGQGERASQHHDQQVGGAPLGLSRHGGAN